MDRSFNAACSTELNAGFNKAYVFHCGVGEKIKGFLPRRESEQRSHPFFRHHCIVVAVGSYLELLRVHFEDYIKDENCSFCFYPGKLLDEIWLTLRHVNFCVRLRCQPKERMEILNEIRDLSKMAVDHFKKYVEPSLEEAKRMGVIAANSRPIYLVSTSSSDVDVETEVGNLKSKVEKQEKEISKLKREQKKLTKLLKVQDRKLRELCKKNGC